MRPDEVSVVDFFSGCGGTSVGFRDAGMKVVGAIDHDQDSGDTFKANFSGIPVLTRDIRGLEIDEVQALAPGGVRLFSGCAPCQPFSRQNKHKFRADPRRTLLQEFQRFVSALRPELVVVENVPGLQSTNNSGPLRAFLRELVSHGYSTELAVLRALEFGVPQERRRLVIVASRIGIAALPRPTHVVTKRPARTVRRAIGHLRPLTDGGVDRFDPDHAAMRLSEANKVRIRATPEGGDRRNWDRNLLSDCHLAHGGHTDAYGRMWWDKPASGLTTRCLSYSNGRFGHPEQDRAISLREAALIQTFPQSFRFEGSLTSRGRQVGNAVPPLMAKRIAQALMKSH
ncbi:DNA cytosine methyltransferase [Mycobacterium colombiense]|uniref:DNA cytosine methyltransferase n=1 Tax=Mycobacterium colombiense TaxID=339268 RepID=UPI0009E34CF6|nr:DNA cytosine methyltransferase [Mycobacterium colombiense]